MILGDELLRAHVVHEKVVVFRCSDHRVSLHLREFYQTSAFVGKKSDFVSSLLVEIPPALADRVHHGQGAVAYLALRAAAEGAEATATMLR
jgi:hypothetical protein